MPANDNHPKKILLIEDDEIYYKPITRWLKKAGYQVTLATSLDGAINTLNQEHIHLAIVDIRLQDDDPQNEDGMKFLRQWQERQLCEVLPAIVLTGTAQIPIILEAYEANIETFIQKSPRYKNKLLEAIEKTFRETIQINFDLGYDVDSDRTLSEVAEDIWWAEKEMPPREVLEMEVCDLFGKLFSKAQRLYLVKLKPGLTGAAVVRVDPTWKYGLGPALVVKISRREKVEIEKNNYEDYVQNLLPLASTRVRLAFSRNLGALEYQFIEEVSKPFVEFDDFYQHETEASIINGLYGLFYDTCRYWYDRRERQYEDLRQLYYQALNLDQDKLVQRFREALPDFNPEAPRLYLELTRQEITNPIYWLSTHRGDCVLPVNRSITHGDLTGRNIMVDSDKRCWLIDFYRTYPSHSLRDFVILETDIKYRLLPRLAIEDFISMERALLQIEFGAAPATLPDELPGEALKAIRVIAALRGYAADISRGLGNKEQNRREYLISLLMTTLNIVRLRHIDKERKLQAVQSAVLLCEEIDCLTGR